MIADLIMPILLDPFIMGGLGLLTHFLLDLIRIKKEENRVLTLKQYWVENPNQTKVCVILVIVVLAILYSTGTLEADNAFAVGYGANSLADKFFGKRTAKLESL